jgi:transposase
METTKRKYSNDFKIKAVELSNYRGALKSVAEELNIPTDTLRKWKSEYKTGKFTSMGTPTVKIKSKEELENISLRKALKDAEMERDILKKALGIFSKRDL